MINDNVKDEHPYNVEMNISVLDAATTRRSSICSEL